MLDNHTMDLGHKAFILLAELLEEGRREYSLFSSPRVRHNPWVTLVGKILCCRNTMHLESQHHQVAGRAVLQHGMIKRIGAGHTISIWEDNCLSGARSLRLMGCLASTTCDMVGELIDHGNHRWQVEKLRETFMALDVDLIMQIPLMH
jgi:hypothetical protein